LKEKNENEKMKHNDIYSSREGTNIRRSQDTLHMYLWAAVGSFDVIGIDCFRIADRSESRFLDPKSGDRRPLSHFLSTALRYAINISYVIISRDAFFPISIS